MSSKTRRPTPDPSEIPLVYVAALALEPGRTVAMYLGLPTRTDAADDEMMPTVDDEMARSVFANDMDDDQWAAARPIIVPEPTSLFHDPMSEYAQGIPTHLHPDDDGSPDADRTCPRFLPQLAPDVEIRTIEAAHNVMLSQPAVDAAMINDVCR